MAAPKHNLDQLLVLDTIVRTGSFAAAAKELYRVPSAITYAIRNLEESLEIEIFEKKGRRSVLTEAGQRVLEQARNILGEARALERLASELAGQWEVTVHVVADSALPITKIVKGVKRFLDRKLPTRIRLDIECQDGVSERYEKERADLMLTLDFDRERGSYTVHRLPLLEMVLVASPNHPLAQLQRVEKSHLFSEVELVVKDTAARFLDSPRRSFMGCQHVIYMPDFHAKRLALVAGIGFGWTPKHLVQKDLESGRLVVVDRVDGKKWTYHPRLVHRSTEPLGPAGLKLVEDLKWSFGIE
ncbi:MAG: LysR family transcriptional regulator [Bradymonadia bacterium]